MNYHQAREIMVSTGDESYVKPMGITPENPLRIEFSCGLRKYSRYLVILWSPIQRTSHLILSDSRLKEILFLR